jgi:acetyl esterase/lipase
MRPFVGNRLGWGLTGLLWFAAVARAAGPYEVELRENVKYGQAGSEDLTLHLALPKGAEGPRPVVLYIHGGGWRAGNKDLHLEDIKEAAARGYVSASIGYRFVPKHKFPAQVEDVKCAVRWVRAHADELKADPKRIGAIGFSAGAHLSMLLGSMGSEDGMEGESGWADQPSQVQAVVAYFGPTNFVGVEYPVLSRALVYDFLGGKEDEQPENFRKASPVTYVSKEDAPMLLFQGTKDLLVPYAQAYEMAEALTKAEVPGKVELLLGAGHGWQGDEMTHTRALTWEFFDKWLSGAPQEAAAAGK